MGCDALCDVTLLEFAVDNLLGNLSRHYASMIIVFATASKPLEIERLTSNREQS